MRNLFRKLGLALVMATAFTTAAHVYQHCLPAPSESLLSCSVCDALLGVSVNSVPASDAVLVPVRLSTPLLVADSPVIVPSGEVSRAPPGALFS